MLCPKNSLGVVTCPCATAGDAVAMTNASGRTAACQRRSARIDIQTSEMVGKTVCAPVLAGYGARDGWNLGRLASGNTRQKGLALARAVDSVVQLSKPRQDAMRRLAVGVFLAAVPLAAQVQPIADSAAAARQAGQWEALGRLAQ